MTSDLAPRLATGSRADWLAFADTLLTAARGYATPGHGRIHFPGEVGGYGHDVDGLEGFARTFLLAGFRIAGARGEGVDELIEFYAAGVATGVDPDAPDRWVRMDEHAQAKVEAASIALVLDMTRPWLWERLDPRTQQRVIDYLAAVVGDRTYPRNNWVWFRIVVETFLRSVGGPWSPEDIADDLAVHEAFVRADGWFSDGHERAYDHYVGWALHVYPVLWARMTGADELVGERPAIDRARLDRYLLDAVHLVGGDGSPLLQGRSLIYRFAAAAPFWAGVIAGVPSTSPGLLRSTAGAIVDHFAAHGAPDADGVLTMGWHGPWRQLAQSYSGPGSPYWAVKGLLGIMLPADHPVWQAPAEPLAAVSADELRAIAAPGWIVSTTAADGLSRVVNHGTDHAMAGTRSADSPLYARIGYASAAAPLLDERAWTEPLEQAVVLVDADGAATHRTAFDLVETRIDGEVGVAASTGDVHWVEAAPTTHRHGSGLTGEIRSAGRIGLTSLVRGPWELRLVHLEQLALGVDPASLRLRVGGWALAADQEPAADAAGTAAEVTVGALRSGIRGLESEGVAAVVRRRDASPLGAHAAVPVVELPVLAGATAAVLITLTAADAASDAVELVLDESAEGTAATVTWPDGRRTATVLADSGARHPADRNSRTNPEQTGCAVQHIAKEQHA